MRLPQRQRGVLLIAAVVIIMVAGVMALVIVTLVAGASGAGAQQLQATQALYIAESGLERAIYRWNLDNTYAGEGPLSFGGGSYTISVFDTDSSGATLPAGRKRLRSVGAIGSSPPGQRTVEVVVGHDLFAEPFAFAGAADFANDWTLVQATGSPGSNGYDGANNCPALPCTDTDPGSGAMLVEADGGSNAATTVRWERTLDPGIVTTSALNVEVEVGHWISVNNNPALQVSILLVDSGGGTTEIWSTTQKNAGWELDVVPVTLNAGRYVGMQVNFDLQKQGNRNILVYLDEIRIKLPGGGVVRTDWLDVIP